MLDKSFELLARDDIDSLVRTAVAENKVLDYKEGLPGNSDGDRKEFFADVSSFANASGGHIIFGVQEKRDVKDRPTGIPEAAKGLANVNADAVILQLESAVRDGIVPRIPGIRTKAIEGFADGPIIIMWIPKSWAAPHMIARKDSRFYSRTSAGKYPLDVSEIRTAFALSESLVEKVERFREERLARIIADETPVLLESGLRVVLHLIPVSTLESTMQISLQAVAEKAALLKPIYSGAPYYRYNFDGLLAYSEMYKPPCRRSYIQFFRNGAIETVECHLASGNGKKLIHSITFEASLSQALAQYLALERSLGIAPPFWTMLSLLSAQGYIMAPPRGIIWPDEVHPIDRDALLLPEILVEDYVDETAAMLHTTFDTVWQAAGWFGSPNYDKDGTWGGDKL